MTDITLTDPLSIGPRLLPCLDLGDGHRIYIERESVDGGRVTWRYSIEIEGVERHTENDLATNAIVNRDGQYEASEMTRDAFASLVDFLLDASESYVQNGMAVEEGTSSDLFPEDMVAWAYAHDQELANAAWLLADGDDQ